jgi:DNA-binding MarR family transcriptional regulator
MLTTAERSGNRTDNVVNNSFTKLQGQYLAFIAMYTKLHRRPPAEADLQEYFAVTPPSVHNMILTLDRLGFIARTPGRARSIEVLVPLDLLPDLE